MSVVKRDHNPEDDVRAAAPMTEAALEQLIDRHADLVLRLAYTYVGNRADAEDLVQTVFLKAFAGAPSFSDAEHEKAWLIRVTANASKDALRARKRRAVPVALDERVSDTGVASLSEAGAVAFPATHDSAASSYEAPGPVTEAVLTLPPAYREVVFLYYYEEYSTREIAALTDSSEVAVRARLSRARKKMRAALEGVCHG